jgi:8-oxo-dGTP pyrophosphatase MutT (NUDIX family)
MPMQIVRAGEPIPEQFTRAVFLAAAEGSWDEEAIELLAAAGFDEGVVYVGGAAPEDAKAGWRSQATAMSDAVVCFAQQDTDRDYITREVLTWAESGKRFVGGAAGSYMDEISVGHGITPERSLPDLIAKAFKMVKAGAERKGAEREVPLMVWRTPPWGLWYASVQAAGNRLDGAKVCWTFRVGPGGAFVLFWAVHANIWVEAEGRHKSNEVVIARPDIACVLAYMPGEQMLDTEIIVIKEFRSPCRNEHGFVYELPGGSSFKPNSDVYQTAADELFEETGIRVEKARLRKEMSRQSGATVTTHHVHLFSCELTKEEMSVAKKCAEDRTVFGNENETERTYIETITLREAIPSSKMDFTGECLTHALDRCTSVVCPPTFWLAFVCFRFVLRLPIVSGLMWYVRCWDERAALGMIMQTIGLFYDIAQAKEATQMAERLERLGLSSVDEEKVSTPAELGESTVAALGEGWERSSSSSLKLDKVMGCVLSRPRRCGSRPRDLSIGHCTFCCFFTQVWAVSELGRACLRRALATQKDEAMKDKATIEAQQAEIAALKAQLATVYCQ